MRETDVAPFGLVLIERSYKALAASLGTQLERITHDSNDRPKASLRNVQRIDTNFEHLCAAR